MTNLDTGQMRVKNHSAPDYCKSKYIGVSLELPPVEKSNKQDIYMVIHKSNDKIEFDQFLEPKDKRYKKLINNLLSDIKTKSIDQIFNDPKYEKLPWFFSKQKWDVKNGDAVNNAYFDNLNKIKAWVTKPTLYQRFTKRLGQEIT